MAVTVIGFLAILVMMALIGGMAWWANVTLRAGRPVTRLGADLHCRDEAERSRLASHR